MLIAAQRRILFPKGGIYARPGRAPGIDPNNPATGSLKLSAVARLGGAPTTLTSTGNLTLQGGQINNPLRSMPLIGANISNGGAGAGCILTGQTTTTPTSVTAAFIGMALAPNNAGFVISNSSLSGGTGGAYFGLAQSGQKLNFQSPGPNTFKTSSFIYPLGAPFFAVAACDGSTTNFVLRNLVTGEVLTSSTSGQTFNANDGTYGVFGFSNHFASQVFGAATMISEADLTAAQLASWANDPWRFWYP